MSASESNGHDLLPYTFATWVFLLHINGERADDEGVTQACEAILAATDETAGNAAGERLVAAVRSVLTGGDGKHVHAAAGKLFGRRASTALSDGDRADRTARIRTYQFTRQLPWLARIWDRGDDGTVRPEWLLVERVTDEVTAADPNPWNDIDETRHIPVGDFHVKWELDACTAVHLE